MNSPELYKTAEFYTGISAVRLQSCVRRVPGFQVMHAVSTLALFGLMLRWVWSWKIACGRHLNHRGVAGSTGFRVGLEVVPQKRLQDPNFASIIQSDA